MPSLFDRATRFPDSAGENRLTEITAATLERDAPFARAFAAALVGRAASTSAADHEPQIARAQAWLMAHAERARVSVETQVARAAGHVRGIVDLQLRLSVEPVRRDLDLLLWIEVKHGADISGDQLRAYKELILSEPAEIALSIVVAPRQKPPTAFVPSDVPVVFWQDVTAVCLRSVRPLAHGTSQALLVNEFTDYLGGQSLMAARPLTTETALALAARQASHDTIVALQTDVHRRVGEVYPKEHAHGGVKLPNYGTGFWATHSTVPADSVWDGAWLEWGLRHDDSHPESRDAYAFVAGLTVPRGDDRLHQPGLSAYVSRCSAAGFLPVTHDKHPRLWNFLYPEQLLSATTLEDQADVLTAWVLSSFDTLMQSPSA